MPSIELLIVVEEVGEDRHDARAAARLRDPVRDAADAGRAARLGCSRAASMSFSWAGPVAPARPLAHVVVEQHQARRVALAQHQVPERGGAPARVVELAPGERAEGHRLAGVDQEVAAEVRLGDELLDHQAVRAREDLPVERAQLVAGHVLAVLRELHRAAALRRAVVAGHEALDHRASHQREPRQTIQHRRVEGGTRSVGEGFH
jgi:hypothetical protein